MESLRELRWPDLLGPRPCCWQRWGGLCRGRVSRYACAEVPSKITPIINRLNFRKDKDNDAPVQPKPPCSPGGLLVRGLTNAILGDRAKLLSPHLGVALSSPSPAVGGDRVQKGSLSQNCTSGR